MAAAWLIFRLMGSRLPVRRLMPVIIYCCSMAAKLQKKIEPPKHLTTILHTNTHFTTCGQISGITSLRGFNSHVGVLLAVAAQRRSRGAGAVGCVSMCARVCARASCARASGAAHQRRHQQPIAGGRCLSSAGAGSRGGLCGACAGCPGGAHRQRAAHRARRHARAKRILLLLLLFIKCVLLSVSQSVSQSVSLAVSLTPRKPFVAGLFAVS